MSKPLSLPCAGPKTASHFSGAWRSLIVATFLVAAPLPAQARLHHHAQYYHLAFRGAHLNSPGFEKLRGVFSPLAVKARAVALACDAVVISGVRRGAVVAGTHRASLHASGHAVDMRGPWGCIYAQLAGWPGGVATDGPRVGHVHFSLGGREDGRRFVHHGFGGGHRRHHRRHRRSMR